MDKATFGAGCFWGVEADFRQVPGVAGATSGYAGGTLENPSYEDVCTGTTGHAEVVEVVFDPERVSYEQLVERFYSLHDPTQRDRQGPDVGTQYRSAIFVHSPEQEAVAQRVTEAVAARTPRPIATEIAPASTFYRAEDYHQRYLERRGLVACAS